MQAYFAQRSDVNAWMRLVREISWNFPGLETEESLQAYQDTVLRFMDKSQALCVKAGDEMTGVLLFSRKHNMICCLGVSPHCRRQGIASTLLRTALTHMNRNVDITVTTFREDDEKGTAPRALYRKFGFQEDVLVEEYDYPQQRFVLRGKA